jgi:hypothetical protein
MHIKVFQSGGFAGDRIQLKDISDSQLSVEKRTLLQTLLDKAAAFETSHSKKSNGEIGADLLQYEIEVPDRQGNHVYKFVKSSNNQPMNDLLDFLLGL